MRATGAHVTLEGSIMRRMLSLAILLPVTAVILAAMVYVVGVERTLAAVRAAGPLAFVGVGALTAAHVLLQAAAWMALNQPIKHRVRFRTVLAATTVGLAGNILTPSTFLGGEPLKVLYVGRRGHLPYHEVAGSVLLSKYLEAISFILFFGFCTAVAAVYYRDLLFGPYLAGGITLVVLAGTLLVLCGVLWRALALRHRPLAALVGLLGRVRPLRRRMARLRERTRQMEEQVSRVFCEEGGASWSAFGALVLTHVAILLKPVAFFCIGTQLHLGLGPLSLIFVVAQALLAFQFTPAGAGTLDGGLLGTFALVGLGQGQAMAYLLCLRLWDATVVGVGAFLAARVGARLLGSKEEPPVPAGGCSGG